jgi:hypothetical protein
VSAGNYQNDPEYLACLEALKRDRDQDRAPSNPDDRGALVELIQRVERRWSREPELESVLGHLVSALEQWNQIAGQKQAAENAGVASVARFDDGGGKKVGQTPKNDFAKGSRRFAKGSEAEANSWIGQKPTET